MVWIPSGSFTMGSPEEEEGRIDEEVQHEVVLTKGFWLSAVPVTQAHWTAVMGKNPSRFKGGNHPVEKVSWKDAQEMLQKMNNLVKEPGNFRLPREAEWEYACRAGTTGAYAGSLDKMGWYNKNAKETTHRVGEKQANGWGLYDMHGNVWEWCEDWYGSYPKGKAVDPSGPEEGTHRVIRGGGCYSESHDCRSAGRNGFEPGDRNEILGFRLLRTAE